MNKLAQLVLALVLAVGGTTVLAAPAQAGDTPNCVSKREFKRVKDGMTKARVHRIFDVNGKREYSGSGGEGRSYRPCEGDPDWSYITVNYERYKGAKRVWFKWRYISW